MAYSFHETGVLTIHEVAKLAEYFFITDVETITEIFNATSAEAEPSPPPASLDPANAQDVRIDLQPFFARNLSEVQHLFGNETSNEPALINYRNYYYDTGITTGVIEGGYITSILIDYRRANDRTSYHFSGIDGTSTLDDVVAMFGNQPATVRAGSIGAVEDHGYWFSESGFVYFSIAANGDVVAISFFGAERPIVG